MNTNYDILIIGGGMVGATLACALADSPLKIGIIENQATPTLPVDTDAYDLRVSAITLATQIIFRNLGVWNDITTHRHQPLRAIEVWEADQTETSGTRSISDNSATIHFDSAEIGTPALGFIIENRVILATLWQEIRRHHNIEIFSSAQVESLSATDTQAQVRLKQGQVLSAHLLVGADGAQSFVRQGAGIETHGWGYDQKGIVATVTISKPHGECAFQRFLPTGPLAFLPLMGQQCSIVWSCTTDTADRLLDMDDSRFIAALQTAFGYRLGEILNVSVRTAFPLSLSHATSYVQPRIAIVGDAAHHIHPLAGQGVNMGLADAATLAQVILTACAKGKDIGAFGELRRYERSRKGANIAMLVVTDSLQRLFGAASNPVKMLRNFGLRSLDKVPVIKKQIMLQALGITGDLLTLAYAAPTAKYPCKI